MPLLDARFVLCRRFADLRTGSVAACQEGAPCRAELKRTQEALQAGQHQAASLARLPEPGEVSGVIVAAVFLCSAWPSTRAGNLEWRYLFLSLFLSLSLSHSLSLSGLSARRPQLLARPSTVFTRWAPNGFPCSMRGTIDHGDECLFKRPLHKSLVLLVRRLGANVTRSSSNHGMVGFSGVQVTRCAFVRCKLVCMWVSDAVRRINAVFSIPLPLQHRNGAASVKDFAWTLAAQRSIEHISHLPLSAASFGLLSELSNSKPSKTLKAPDFRDQVLALGHRAQREVNVMPSRASWYAPLCQLSCFDLRFHGSPGIGARHPATGQASKGSQ